MIGDLKCLLMVQGCDGYSGSQCFYCKLKISDWKKVHSQGDQIICGGEKWNIKEMENSFVMGNQPDSASNPSARLKEVPMWSFIPVDRYLLPLLHILLGMGNNVMNRFFDWVEERVEPLTTDEIEARSMSLITEITSEESRDEFNTLRDKVVDMINERKKINEEIKLITGERKSIIEQTSDRHLLENLRREEENLKVCCFGFCFLIFFLLTNIVIFVLFKNRVGKQRC